MTVLISTPNVTTTVSREKDRAALVVDDDSIMTMTITVSDNLTSGAVRGRRAPATTNTVVTKMTTVPNIITVDSMEKAAAVLVVLVEATIAAIILMTIDIGEDVLTVAVQNPAIGIIARLVQMIQHQGQGQITSRQEINDG